MLHPDLEGDLARIHQASLLLSAERRRAWARAAGAAPTTTPVEPATMPAITLTGRRRARRASVPGGCVTC